MKKRFAAILLSFALLGLTAGCGSKDDTSKTEESTTGQTETAEESFQLTNADGKVVAADVENLEDYVTLGAYKNLEVEEEAKEQISDEDVESYVENLMAGQTPVEVTEDRAVQEKDTVNIDYTGYKDGEAFEGGTDTGYDLVIGSGSFIDGFEDGLIGHKKGEEVTLDLTFPEEYHAEDLAGQAVQFKVKINKISEPPVLDDAWVEENSDYKTVEEFKAGQKEMLQQTADSSYESQVKSDLFTLVVENSEIKSYPEDLMETTKKDVENRIESAYAAPSGLTLEEYYEQSGVTEEEAEQIIQEMAENFLKQNLITQAILNAEGIELTEEQYNEEKENYAKLSGFEDAAQMESMYSADNQSLIRDSVLWNRACDVLMDTAVIKEKQASEETEE